MDSDHLAKDFARFIMLDHNSPQFRFQFLCMQDKEMRPMILRQLKVHTALEMIDKFMEESNV